ncbi:MAG TPA: POTRA domain-containing protein [Terriglobales bacterium]|nr:POTRA domain-containing protein [Terriglobales bacterium]
MRPAAIAAFLLLGLCGAVAGAAAMPSPAQKAPSSFRLASITAEGSKRYSSDQIVAASGLETGATAGEDDFKHAAQQLGDTGAFAEVSYSYHYSGNDAKLEFQVSDAEPFVPARFDNFVWFSDQELLSKIHQEVPLFSGELPLSGNLADQVSNTLQGMVIEQKVEGKVDYLRSAEKENGPINAIVFSVNGPRITIHNSNFTGAGPQELPLLQAAAHNLAGQEYQRSILRVQAERNFLPIFLQRGFLKARFGQVQAKVVEQDPDETVVDVSFAVEPGRQYRLGHIGWSGNKVFSTSELQPAMHVLLGEPADAVQLDADLEAVKKMYGGRGYVAAFVHPEPQFDESAGKVSYTLEVHEGDLYHMGDLDIQGLDRTYTDRVSLAWQLRQGDVYNSTYPKQFLDDIFKKNLIGGGWNVAIHDTPDPRTKTVDVTLRFDSKR